MGLLFSSFQRETAEILSNEDDPPINGEEAKLVKTDEQESKLEDEAKNGPSLGWEVINAEEANEVGQLMMAKNEAETLPQSKEKPEKAAISNGHIVLVIEDAEKQFSQTDPIIKIDSEPIELLGLLWKMDVNIFNNNGWIGMGLSTPSRTENYTTINISELDITFRILNKFPGKEAQKESGTKKYHHRHVFSKGSWWTVGGVAKVEDVLNPENGFLNPDGSITAEVHFTAKEHLKTENLVKAEPTSVERGHLTLTIAEKQLDERYITSKPIELAGLKWHSIVSEPVELAGIKWNLSATIGIDSNGKGGSFSTSLMLGEKTKDYIHATLAEIDFTFQILNKCASNEIKLKWERNFDRDWELDPVLAPGLGWGLERMAIEDLLNPEKGFLNSDGCIVAVADFVIKYSTSEA